MMVRRPKSGDPIDRALQKVEALGFTRPPNMTLHRFLSMLAGHGLVSEETTAQFLESYENERFASQATSSRSAEGIAVKLAEEAALAVEKSNSTFPDLRQALSSRSTPPVRRPTQKPDEEPRTASAPNTTPPPPATLRPHSAEPLSKTARNGRPSASLSPLHFKLGRHHRWIIAAVALTIWTALSVGLGYLNHDLIAKGLHDLTAHVLELPFNLGSGEYHLDAVRRLVSEHPDSIGAWRSYADQALRRDRFPEAVVALRRLVSLQPDNARTLNELAWLLCTAEDTAVRDPIQALELAERAYSLDPSPAITDTLAEAVFLNGDPRRAATLEEDALARIATGQDHYVRQLEKFRAAAEIQ